MKQLICTILGVISSVIASFFGGWDAGFTTLLIFMGLDYISGLLVAGVFKNSPKTATGALESKVGWKGLCRKGMTRVFVEEISYFLQIQRKYCKFIYQYVKPRLFTAMPSEVVESHIVTVF